MDESLFDALAESLSCRQCDADSPATIAEAVMLGWADLTYAPDGEAENFMGLCPDCRNEEIESKKPVAKKKRSKARKGA